MRLRSMLLLSFAVLLSASLGQADDRPRLKLDKKTKARCLEVLRAGMRSDEFWPSIHAAEGLTLGGHGKEVIEYLTPKVNTVEDDQQRCGVARELVRAGEKRAAKIMLAILGGDDDFGHVHAAESLYKVDQGAGSLIMKNRFSTTQNLRLKLMSGAALARKGDKEAFAFLREMLGHEDPELFKVAAWVLGRIGDETDIARLRKELPRCKDEITRVYFENSLAALGDEGGLKALARNLKSEDPAVRTYAATFAGDAWAINVADSLKAMLDDPHADARYRAAQSLLQMSRPAKTK